MNKKYRRVGFTASPSAELWDRLKRTYPEDPTRHVSHETIYRSVYVQARGVLVQCGGQSQTAPKRTRHRSPIG